MNVFDLLSEDLKKLIASAGFEKPTPPQKRSIPLILNKENILLVSPTGSGKTEAVMLPLFDLIKNVDDEGIFALYIAPLRALNRDLLDRLINWCAKLKIDIQVRHGDTTQYQRRKQTLNPPKILITTPETLQSILIGKKLLQHLKSVRWVVVDEIHELAEDKRGVQLSLGLERLQYFAKHPIQRIGLSATVSNPHDIGKFLVGTTKDCQVVEVKKSRKINLSVEFPKPTSKDAKLKKKLLVSQETIARLRRIRELVENHNSTLTFVNTRQIAEILASRFHIWDPNIPIDIHHGSLAKESRISTEGDFKSENLKSVISTSSLELGIDIGSIDLVIQYMSPRRVYRMVQRVGRGGRSLDVVSKGVILTIDFFDTLEASVIAKRAKNFEIEKTRVYSLAKDVLAHQIVGLIITKKYITSDEIYSILKSAYPYRDLKKIDVDEVLDTLQDLYLIRKYEQGYGQSKRALIYYFTNVSTIPDQKKYKIVNITSNSIVGTLDEEFVATKGEKNLIFVCKGRAWRVVSIEDEKVVVESVNNPELAIPSWEGELIPVPYEVAKNCGKILRKFENKNFDDYLNSYPSDTNSKELINDTILSQKSYLIPSDKKIIIESYETYNIIHSYSGTKINETLGRVISTFLSSKLGTSVSTHSDPYHIAIRAPDIIEADEIKKLILDIDTNHIEPLLKLALKRTSMFKWRLFHVAKRFGAIRKDADMKGMNLNRILRSYQDTPLFDEAYREIFFDKLDIDGAILVLSKIQNGEISIQTTDKISPLSEPILDEISHFGDLITPNMPEREILELVKKRLLKKKMTLFCFTCKDYFGHFLVENIDNRPKCNICKSNYLTIFSKYDEDSLKALKKFSKGKKLKSDEKKVINKLRSVADLILEYGKRAIIALAGVGVGPTNATRILSRMHESERDFIKDIIEAEKVFAQTKQWWAKK